MISPSEKSFRDRLKWVLGDRKITPWALSLGLSRGMVSRISEGHVPRSGVLALIARVEGVNLNWLLDGGGQPFSRSVFQDGQEAVDYVRLLLAEEDWNLYLMEAPGERRAAVLALPAQIEIEDRAVGYTATEIVLAPPGTSWESVLEAADDRAWYVPLDGRTWSRLESGELGTYELIGSPETPGLLADAVGLEDSEQPAADLAGVRENGSRYCPDDELGQAYQRLADRNPAKARRRLLELLEQSMDDLEHRSDEENQ